ncbi:MULTISPECIES: hypothetical protein [unclassified Micromonospora]|uniref:hypothetical protein n=1 Tax=unclassified Micromonospora TaxID=2617518 RepID=UPI00339E8A57
MSTWSPSWTPRSGSGWPAGRTCSPTDDPAIFDITLADEYAFAGRLGVDAATAYASACAECSAMPPPARLVAVGERAYGTRPGATTGREGRR